MFLFDIFRSFQPIHNPIGFGVGDFVELAFVALLIGVLLAWRWWMPGLRALAQNTRWSMGLLAALPVAMRIFLLPRNPIPTPGVSDDFSYLLLADTLAHFRLANATHPMHRFFETFFVLQEPTYSSIFPLGQGLVLAVGQVFFRHPWAGVAMSVGAFCALCYWMLRAWVTPSWALAGGLLAVFEFGPLNQWMNSYWGGAVAAAAGCLVFGALPRLRREFRLRDAVLLGAGIGISMLTRPFESVLLIVCVALFIRPKAVPFAAAAIVPAIALIAAHNYAVTGSVVRLPYMVSRYQYGVPTTFTFQAIPEPHRELTREQKLDYEIQSDVHGTGPDTPARFVGRLLQRARFVRFFWVAPLYLALPFFLLLLGEWRYVWVTISLAVFALGTAFYPYFYTHYVAAVTCLFVLVGIAGLERLSRLNRPAAAILLALCVVHFGFWYGLHVIAAPAMATELWRYETWDAINQGDPQGRIAVNDKLAQAPGKQLVFVRYGPQHQFEECVHNGADIDASRVVWARDLGTEEDQRLMAYYPDRTVWILEPDAKPVSLLQYRPLVFETVR